MKVRMLVLLMIAGTAMAQQTGGGGAPGPTEGGGSGAPTGSAGGALTGSYPSPGLNPSAAIIPSPTGSQSITQPGSTTLQLNNLLVSPINNVVYVDGVNGAGIGVGQSAWSSSNAYPQCTAVSYSGGNYLGVTASTDVTPGTNSAIWYPVPNAATPTQLDCAFYTAASKVRAGAGAAMRLGPGTYLSNVGLVEPTVTVPGWPIVNIYGQGRAVTTVKLNTNNGDGFPFLYLPKTSVSYAFASFNWEGFTVDANYNSTGAVGIYGAQQYTLKDMIVADAADGSDHEIEFGDSTDTLHGWTFEPDIENVDLGTFKGFGSGAYASATVTGGVPSFTIVNGGSGYNSADTQVILGGTSDYGKACASAGTTTATINGSGVITAITSTATGCVAPLYPIIYGGPNINYGYKFSNTTDAKKITNMTNGGVGWIAGMYIADTDTALKIYNYHPESVLQGALILGSADFYSSQCDTVFQYCFNIQGGGTVNFHSPFFEWNNPNMTGSRDYLFLNQSGGVPGYSQPQAVNIENETCGNTPQQPGYAHFDSTAGVIDSGVGSDAGTLPVYVHATNPQYCNLIGNGNSNQQADPTLVGQNIQMSNGTTGNIWNWNTGSGDISGGSNGQMTITNPFTTNIAHLGMYDWNFANPTASTSGNNYGSPQLNLSGTFWNGSTSTPFGVGQQLTLASGSNPLATYSFFGTGTAPSGGLQYTFPGATVVLPSGSTATSQAVGDNTTKVATDAFVLANGGVSSTPSAAQSIVQPGSTTLMVNNLNHSYFVDGFTATGYPGIGVAQTAWSSGTYSLCTAVSYSGGNYLSVGTTTGVTPGTNAAAWWPVNNANTPTQTDCAFYYTLAQATAAGSSYTLQFGNSTYDAPYTTAIGLAEPSSQTQVNLIGAGRGFNNQLTTLKATTSIGNGWVISAPDKSGSLPYNLTISNMNIDGGGLALGCMKIYGEKVGLIEHIGCVNWNPTSGSAIPIAIGDGSSPYENGGYQMVVNDIFVSGSAGTRGIVTATVSGGSPLFTVSSGGSYSNIPSRAWVWGFGQGAKPCTTMGTLATTYTGTGPYVLTGVTASGFSGCTGTLYAFVPDISAAPYGIAISLMTDSTFRDLVVANAGWDYGIFWNGSGANEITHEHVYGDSQTQITDSGASQHIAAEIDTPTDIGAASGASTTWTDTLFVYPGNYSGITGFYAASGSNIVQSTCGSSSSNVFNLLVNSSGPVAHGGNFGTANVVNAQECDTMVAENSNAAPLYTALTAGSTAATQSAGDNSTKVATDAFVATATANQAATNAANSFTAAQTAPGFFPQSKAAGPYSVLFDDYYSGANNAANIIGSSTTASCAVNTTYTDINHPGNLLLTAGTSGTGTGITCGYQSETPSVLSPNSGSLGWTWETAVYVPVLPGTTAGSFQGGLTNGPNANPWTTGIQFYLSSANSVANDWYCRYSSTSTDSTIPAVAATWTRLTMVNDGTYVHWYINGTEATGCKTAVASMPSSAQYPASWSATALSASSVTMAVDYVDFQRATAR